MTNILSVLHVGMWIAQWLLGATSVGSGPLRINEYVRHKRSLLSKARKPKVTTPSASAASVTPSESPSLSQVATPSPTSLADDEKLKKYVHSFLSSMRSQQSGQVSLGSNPFVSAPSVEVPDLPPLGSTGGKTTESLSSRLVEFPSGMVPPPPQEDVMPPHPRVCVAYV